MNSAFTQPDNSSDEANERLARQLNVSSVPGTEAVVYGNSSWTMYLRHFFSLENSLNTQALPNPWAAQQRSSLPSATNTSNTTSSAAPTAQPGSNPFGGKLFFYILYRDNVIERRLSLAFPMFPFMGMPQPVS